MNNPSRATRVTDCANAVIGRIGLMRNPYLQALRTGQMSKDAFRASQEQFFFAVRYFPRPMAALLARLPDPDSRLDILRNIVEEHGEFHREQFHQNTFRAFLASIGGSSPSAEKMWPVVHAFNSTLMAACAMDDLDVGICAMGVIEHAFAEISAIIGKAVVDRGWVKDVDLVHYKLHAEIDVRHAEEFFAIVESGWDEPLRRTQIQMGLELGAYAFDQLYRGLNGGKGMEALAGK